MGAASEPEKARIELELERGAEPIRGEIREPDGARSTFLGWLELAGALERIRGRAEPNRKNTDRERLKEV